MVQVKKEGIILEKTAFGFECEGVFNPGVIKVNGTIIMLYRAVAKNNYSTIGYCELSSALVVSKRNEIPLIFPQFEYESRGIEDPRIVYIDDVFYITYCAYSGFNALGALAVSYDLHHWKKLGVIVPKTSYSEFKHLAESHGPIHEKYARYNNIINATEAIEQNAYIWNKDCILFPRKINGKYCFLHRIKPDIQIVTGIDNLEELTHEYWQNYLLHFSESTLLCPRYEHEASYLGGGCPPIETSEGWLVIYHGVQDSVDGYIYSACASLLSLELPIVEIARLPYPLFGPDLNWEITGIVNNVCFPTGAIQEEERLYIYYGAADERIAVASVNINELINELLANKIEHNVK